MKFESSEKFAKAKGIFLQVNNVLTDAECHGVRSHRTPRPDRPSSTGLVRRHHAFL